MDSNITFLIAIATFLGGAFLGLAALRKSGSEASKASADATAVIVTASADVVKQLREQMDALSERLDEEEDCIEANTQRIAHLEEIVNTWENWADKVLALLDRSLSMLTPEQAESLHDDVTTIKKARPTRKKGVRQ